MSIDVILTADDCGLTPAINEETVRLHRMGCITAASVMMNMPHADHALSLFADYPQLETGVHLNLTDGLALYQRGRRSTIARDDGTLKDVIQLFARSVWLGDSLERAIRDELRAQIAAYQRRAGLPTHLTTHMHFHVVPALRRIVYELADEIGVRWVRARQYRASIMPYDPFPNAPEANPSRRFIVPDYLATVQMWLDEGVQTLYENIVDVQSGSVEVVVHPDIADDPDFPPAFRYNASQRAAEVRFLEALCERFKQNQTVHLTNFLT